MSDSDDSSERDRGDFVFGNDEAANSNSGLSSGDRSGSSDGVGSDEELDTRRIAAVLLLSLAIIVLAVVVVQPLVTGVATNLFGADSPSEPGNVTNATTAGEPIGSADTTAGTTGDDRPSAATTAAVTSGQSPTAASSATTTPGEATTASATTQTVAQADENTTASENATATSSDGSPVIEGFTVTDRSADGNASFDVAWNVSDPNSDLVDLEVTIVADPDGEARTVASRRFDAGGASTAGSETFGVEGGSGDVYEVRMEVIDGAGNSVFTLTREVADGDPDG
ncbi:MULTISPECIES: hypothetical protein [Halococcus]|uniref:Uncharacterized protein n=1 Tax=Halococcus salifodinae DSM 8989 TaxID=1227456 RepID=M0N1I8_9EURY|nr:MULTISPECIES: hypothetical protein [Halococcus]EMA50530.1 hypothetical protein C450_14838 [Halococcus salifodinae DSM 8989]